MLVRSRPLVRVLVALSMLALLAGCSLGAAPTGRRPRSPDDRRVQLRIRSFEILTDTATVPAGSITFSATNTDVQKHELLVVPFAGRPSSKGEAKVTAKAHNEGALEQLMAQMVYDRGTLRLDEEQLGSLGEVADLEGGTSGEVTLDLPPGTYLLLCNLPLHFQSGMWTQLNVTP